MFARKRQLQGRRILITGASSGIGAALAKELLPYRPRLLLTARRQERLEQLSIQLQHAGLEVATAAGDITDAEHREKLVDLAKSRFGGLDILINNAGMGGIGTFADADESRLRYIMEVNFFAPFELLRKSLPLLEASDDAVVVNIGSVLGHCAVPKKSEYCASKFALHGMTDALRMELSNQRVDVLLVSPSTTQSEFFDKAMRSAGNVPQNNLAMSPAAVARATIRTIKTRQRETILSWGGKLLVMANRIAPGTVSRILQRFA